MNTLKGYLITAVILLAALELPAQLETTKFSISEGLAQGALKSAIETNISELLTACNTALMNGKKPKLASNFITKDGEKNLLSIWKTNEFSCNLSELESRCLKKPGGGYQIRNIPVSFFALADDESQREIVINLTSDGKVDDIFVAIQENVYNDIIAENESVEDLDRRQIIIDFVENFRTAYERKDLTNIERVFSDNALIITGKVIKEKPKSDQAIRSLGQERVEYLVQTKSEYVKRLKMLFSVYKRIDLKFDSIEVIKHPVINEIYGVTLLQDWRSKTYADSKYSDVGYLFLMIDFRGDEPMIQVRTWQPTVYNNRPLQRDEVFSINSFPEITRKEN